MPLDIIIIDRIPAQEFAPILSCFDQSFEVMFVSHALHAKGVLCMLMYL